MSRHFVPFIEEIKIENFSDYVGGSELNSSTIQERIVGIANELINMGFDPKIVLCALKYFEVQDLQSAADLLIKSSFGWPHSFVRGDKGICEVCGESFQEHIEAGVDDDVNNVARLMPLPVFGNKRKVDRWRTSFQCKICMQGIPIGYDFHLSCRHMYCEDCVSNFLKTSIDSRAILELYCPEEACDVRFSKKHIKELCTEQTFQKYLKFCEDYEVSTNKKLRWCPIPYCGRYVENLKGKSYAKCDCGTKVCFDCGGEWETGHRCKGNPDSLYKYWAKNKNIQQCPKCKIRIEKDEGCNHMTCTHCRYQWCWVCGEEYTSNHYSGYFFGCPFVQFTNRDWSLKRIVFYHLLIFLFSPLFSILSGFTFMCKSFSDVEAFRSCKYLVSLMLLILYLPLSLIVGVLMIVPTVGFRFYCFIHAIDRAVNG